MREKEKQKEKLDKKLLTRIGDEKRSRKNRLKRKEDLKKIFDMHPDAAKLVKLRTDFGRPRIEETQPLLLQVIADIAIHGSAAHEKRQSDIYRSVKTLNELCTEINKRDNFSISRSALYLRLLPKRSNSSEGKRHVKTCPVKLVRSENDKHCTHPDGRFCTSTINLLEELASFLGPKQVCFISQDDKTRFSVGLTAAKHQAPMLMHVEYKISLPDHDWVVAAKHKLIPSVYAGIVVKENAFGKPDAVGYILILLRKTFIVNGVFALLRY